MDEKDQRREDKRDKSCMKWVVKLSDLSEGLAAVWRSSGGRLLEATPNRGEQSETHNKQAKRGRARGRKRKRERGKEGEDERERDRERQRQR